LAKRERWRVGVRRSSSIEICTIVLAIMLCMHFLVVCLFSVDLVSPVGES